MSTNNGFGKCETFLAPIGIPFLDLRDCQHHHHTFLFVSRFSVLPAGPSVNSSFWGLEQYLSATLVSGRETGLRRAVGVGSCR